MHYIVSNYKATRYNRAAAWGFGGKGYELGTDATFTAIAFSSGFAISMAYFKVKSTLKVADSDQVSKEAIYTGYRPIPKGFGPDFYKEFDRRYDSIWEAKERKGQTRSAWW